MSQRRYRHRAPRRWHRILHDAEREAPVTQDKPKIQQDLGAHSRAGPKWLTTQRRTAACINASPVESYDTELPARGLQVDHHFLSAVLSAGHRRRQILCPAWG